MTSMIDVVFLLLIFFIVSASFVETERELKSTIQTDQAGGNRDLEQVMIDIVDAGGRFVYRLGGRDIVSPAELEQVLNGMPAQSKFDGAFVRVSDGAPFDMPATAMSLCKEARFSSVTYIPARTR
jgi:biopolymer transport protein ExbD